MPRKPPPVRKASGNLTPKQQLFCREYLTDLNASQAAIRAGYSKATAGSSGFTLLQIPHVQAEITKLRDRLMRRTEISQERVLEELRRIAFSDPRRVMSWGPNGITLIDSTSLDDEDAAAVAEASETKTESGGSVRIKMHDKLEALDKLARYLGLFVADRSAALPNATLRVIVVDAGQQTPPPDCVIPVAVLESP